MFSNSFVMLTSYLSSVEMNISTKKRPRFLTWHLICSFSICWRTHWLLLLSQQIRKSKCKINAGLFVCCETHFSGKNESIQRKFNWRRFYFHTCGSDSVSHFQAAGLFRSVGVSLTASRCRFSRESKAAANLPHHEWSPEHLVTLSGRQSLSLWLDHGGQADGVSCQRAFSTESND